MTVAARYWSKVGMPTGQDDCWPWLGATRGKPGNAYGIFWLDGRNQPAHRVAWMLHHRNPFPDGMDACHTCDNPLCVNPHHVFPGTPSDNARDALSKGRLAHQRYPRKTHCKRGHELTPENTQVGTNGGRTCKRCRTDLQRERRAKARTV
jgi:hypothetical protein